MLRRLNFVKGHMVKIVKESWVHVVIASMPPFGNVALSAAYGVGAGGEWPGESGAAHF